MKTDTLITAAAKRMTMLLETGYLPSDMARDIKTLMEGAIGFELMFVDEDTKAANDPPGEWKRFTYADGSYTDYRNLSPPENKK